MGDWEHEIVDEDDGRFFWHDKGFSTLLHSDLLAGLNPVEQVKVAREMEKEGIMSKSIWEGDTPDGLYKRLWQEGVAHRVDYELVLRDKEGAEVASSRTLTYGISTVILVDDVWIDGKLRYEAGSTVSPPDNAEYRAVKKEEKGDE